MKNTGVFLSEEEKKRALELVTIAQTTPVIMIGNVDCAGTAWNSVQRFMEEMAEKYHLPKIPGVYGLTEEGEFVEP